MGQPGEELDEAGPGETKPGEASRWLLPAAIGVVVLAVLLYLLLRPPAPVCLAINTSLTGESATQGTESLAAIRLAVAEANRAGGVHDRRIELVTYDDRSDPDVGRRNAAAIGKGPCLAVLGHYTSVASLAAGPVYREAKIPALTASAFADELTEDNPWYFRAQITASMQGQAIAEYLTVFNEAPQLQLVHSSDSFGRSFAEAFLKAYPAGRAAVHAFEPDPRQRATVAGRLVQSLPQGPGSDIVVLGTASANIPPFVIAMRRSGRNGAIITTAGAGSPDFLTNFASEPEEQRRLGYFSDNLFAVPPVIFDSAGSEAQAFAARYREASHRQPSWIAAGYYDATRALIEAVRRAPVSNRPETRAEDREQIRLALAAMNGPLTGVRGLTRMVYFNARRNMPGYTRMGIFARGRFMTSARQLVPVEQPETIDVAQETEAGHVVTIGGQPFWLQQVVYTGMDFNRIARINLKDGTFQADLNLWMRFIGGDESLTKVEFPDLLDPEAFDPARPVEASAIVIPPNVKLIGVGPSEPYNYRLYRIVSEFKADYDLHDYPFDKQQLLVRLLNRDQRRELVTYVVDSQWLDLTNSQQRLPEDLSAFRGLQQWQVQAVRYYVESLTLSSTLGKPSLSATVPVEYTFFNVAVELQREFGIFLIKTMVPLILLATVVFATLFLPGNLFRERINIPITAILTSSVLLLSVNNQIGDIGYTVAIEYIFYAFFALCLSAMLIGISHDVLSEQGHARRATALARVGQVFYVTMVLAVIVVVWWRYAP